MSHANVRNDETVILTKDQQLAAAREEAKQLKAARLQREQIARDAAIRMGQERMMGMPEHTNIETLFDGIEIPSWKRVLCGFVLGLVGAGAVGYGIGLIMAYALAGIATLTASAGLAFCLSVLVWIIGIYAAWKIGGWVGGKIFASVVLPEGLASRSMQSIQNAAAGAGDWFSNRPSVQAVRQFSGAHVTPAGAA